MLLRVLCSAARSNAAEIAGAMHELGAMQRQAADLRRQLLAGNATLQASHSAAVCCACCSRPCLQLPASGPAAWSQLTSLDCQAWLG